MQKVIRSFPLKLKICLTNEEIGKCLSSILIKDTNPLDEEFYVIFIKPINQECAKRWSGFDFQRSTIYFFFKVVRPSVTFETIINQTEGALEFL